jgi:GNAT superfamily N-acetyltransferase
MNVEIVKLGSDDLARFKEILRLFEDVFEMSNFQPPSDAHLTSVLRRPDFHAFAALESGAVIGGLTAYTLHQIYSVRPLVYVFDLAVRADRQRQGVGTRLMAAINAWSREAGMEEVFVQADLADDYAIDFYRKTGGSEESVVHFTYSMAAEDGKT